jgi:hypothetical protein
MTPIEIVKKFYQLNKDVRPDYIPLNEMRMLLADDFIFTGPLMKIEGADNYIGLLSQLLPYHESLNIVRQFADKNEVCTITQIKLNPPNGQSLKLDIAEWIIVANGKLQSHTIYYDPRGFMEAFPM